MSYQKTIPGTKYIIELAQVNEDWYLLLKIGENVEEEAPITRFTLEHLREDIDQLLRAVGFPLNQLQLDMVSDDMMQHVGHLFGIPSSSSNETVQKRLDEWTQTSTPSEVRIVKETKPVHVTTDEVRVTPAARLGKPSKSITVDDIIPALTNLRKAVRLIEERISELEDIVLKKI